MRGPSTRPSLAALALCGLLAACGGGGSPPPGPTDAVPAEASESSAGLVRYLLALAAAMADDKEPVDLGGFDPKRPDDTEPEPLS